MHDRFLAIAVAVLRGARGVNWVFAIGFGGALILSLIFAGDIVRHLHAKYPAIDAAAVLNVMRVMGVMGIVASAAVHEILRHLLAIVGTVRDSDPFVDDNAARLQRIGWALVVLQVLDLATGLVVLALDRLAVDHATWTPGFTGWIAALMLFVLARVFRVGAAMRDDLAMTV